MTTSSDSVLTATASDPTASILLTVNFSALAPAGTVNRILNPSNEAGALLAAGASSAVTQSATFARTGLNSSRLTRSTGSGTVIGQTPSGTSGIPVTDGETVAASCYVRSTTSRTPTLGVAFYTAAGASVGSTTTGTGVVTSTSAFTTRLSVTATAPATAAYAQLILTIPSVASTSEFHYADDFQLEKGSTATAFAYGGAADADWVGAADASMSVRPPYDKVTVTRADGTIVRGLDSAVAPGGMTRGIDHEAPLGAAVVYTASITNGLATITSTTATATSGVASNASWLKSLRYPALSVAIEVAVAPDWADDIPTGVLYPIGSGVSGVVYPNVSQGQRQGDRGTLTVECETKAARDALLTLLRSPGPYLLQLATNSNEPDQYVAAGAVQRQWAVDVATEPWRTVPIPLTAVARPPTTGSAVALPGHTYADSLVAAPLYSNRTGTYGSR